MQWCHGLMQKATDFNDVTIAYVKRSAYGIYFWYMSNDNAINIMNNSNLNDKMGVLYFFFFIYKKMSNTTYYKKKQGRDTK